MASEVTNQIVYGKFPDSWMALEAFAEIASDPQKALKLEEAVKNHANQDPDMLEKSKARNEKDSELFLYDVIQAGSSPTMCVHGTAHKDKIESVQDLYKMFIDQNVRVVVALNTASEWEKAIHYYDPEILDSLNIGWEITCEKCSVLYEGRIASPMPKTRSDEFQGVDRADERLAEFRPRIEERTFIASDGKTTRTITHLHYINWPDKNPAPDLEALDILFKRQEELIQTPEDALSIHCGGGIGRTAAYALMTWIRSEIRALKASGEKLSEQKFNTAEMMYELKQQAPRLWSGTPNGERCAQVHDVSYRHYREVEAQ